MGQRRTADSHIYYDEEEDVLAKWAGTCQIKCRLHRVAARNYAHHSKNTTIVILILQTCAGSLTLSNDVPTWAEPMVALLQLALAVMLAIASYLKMEQRAEAHRAASLSYGEIHKTVSTLLARRESERPPAVGMVDATLQQIIQLDKNSPLLPMKLCDKEAKRSHITEKFQESALPDELNGLSDVIIYGRRVSTIVSAAAQTFAKPPLEKPPVSRGRSPVREVISDVETDTPTSDMRPIDEEVFVEAEE